MDFSFLSNLDVNWMAVSLVFLVSTVLAVAAQALSSMGKKEKHEVASTEDDIPVLTDIVYPEPPKTWEGLWNDAIRKRNEAERELSMLVELHPIRKQINFSTTKEKKA